MYAINLRTCAVASLALASFSASAAPADPASPSAGVLETKYESVFTQYRPAADEPAGPDAVWKSANAAVAGAGHEGHAMNMPMGGMSSAPVAKPAGHEGHSMAGHGGMAMPMDKKPSAPPSAKEAPAMNMQHDHGKGH